MIIWVMAAAIGSASAQHDDLYFVPKKKAKVENSVDVISLGDYWDEVSEEYDESDDLSVTTTQGSLAEMDEDAYNRRGSYLAGQSEAEGNIFALITEDGDTMWVNTDTLNLTTLAEDDGWVGGFDGSELDYEYAMRIIRFRNPRYAIPVSSPLYWDVVYGGTLWPSWEWNIYDDGMYAYVFPTSSNWYYWDYRVNYPFGWNSSWGYHYNHYGHYYPTWHYPTWHYHAHTWHGSWPHLYPHFRPIGGYAPRPNPRPSLGTNNPGKHGASSPATPPAQRRPVASSTRHSASSSRISGSRVGTSSSRTSRPTTQRAPVGTSERVGSGRPSSASGPATPSRSRSTSRDEKVERGTSGSPSVSRSSSTSRSHASTSRTSQSVGGGASSSRSSSSSFGSGSQSRTSSGSSSSRSSSSRSSSYSGGASRGGSRR